MEQGNKKKPLLFLDWDGTLCTEHYWRSLPYDFQQMTQKWLFGADLSIVNEWMRGQHTAWDVNAMLAEHLKVPISFLWRWFVRDCKTMKPLPGVLERVLQLRETYTVVLITGNMDSFSDYTVPALDLEKYFDAIVNSYHEQRHKVDNHGALFLEAASRHEHFSLEDAFLIDDSSAICEMFEQLGGTAVQVSETVRIERVLDQLLQEKIKAQ